MGTPASRRRLSGSLRRAVGWLVVAAVVAVAAAAIATALMGERETASPSTTAELGATTASATIDLESGPGFFPDVAVTLRRAGVVGLLSIVDDECRQLRLELPTLAVVTFRGASRCSFRVSPGEPDSPNNPGFQAFAAPAPPCREDARCSPSWKPNGSLTVVERGAVVEILPRCGADGGICRRSLVSAAAVGAALEPLERPRLREHAWLTDRRLLVLARAGPAKERRDRVAVLEDGRLVELLPLSERRLSLVRVSPKRSFVAIRSPHPRRLWIVEHGEDGFGVMRFSAQWLPRSADIRSIAWSPDERWTAIASSRVVYVFATGARPETAVEIPLSARDLSLT